MDTLVKLATIASPLVSAGVAIWVILVAKATISESKEIAKKTIADTAYQAYLQLAIENPHFSKGYTADGRHERDPMYDQYVWYVARMIFCFEKIVEVEGNFKDESWEKTLKKHLEFHSEYFKKTKVVKKNFIFPQF
ncbi:restriction endonuclease [Salmonella enterica]|uniref:restriction endonuclease n=1 Tax=Salmonella enterica TaxID=28901 RepID=UPI003EDBAFE6